MTVRQLAKKMLGLNNENLGRVHRELILANLLDRANSAWDILEATQKTIDRVDSMLKEEEGERENAS